MSLNNGPEPDCPDLQIQTKDFVTRMSKAGDRRSLKVASKAGFFFLQSGSSWRRKSELASKLRNRRRESVRKNERCCEERESFLRLFVCWPPALGVCL